MGGVEMTTHDSVENMQKIVERYVKEHKGLNVTVNVLKGIHPQGDIFFQHKYISQVEKLCWAVDWIEKERLKKLKK